METTRTSRRWRTWLWLGGVFGALLLLSGLVVWMWCRSDSDLDTIRAMAKAMGIPTTYEELALVPSPAEVTERASRVRSSAPATYSSSKSRAPSSLGWRLFEPVPVEMQEHHRGLDQAKMDQWLADLDASPPVPVMFAQNQDEWLGMRMSHWAINPATLIAERAALVDPAGLSHELTRLVHLVDQLESSHMMTFRSRRSVIDCLVSVITARIEDIRPQPGELPRHLSRLADESRMHLTRSCHGTFVRELINYTHGQGAPMTSEWPRWLRPAAGIVAGRHGRAAFLHAFLRVTQIVRQHARPDEQIVACRQLIDELMAMSPLEAGVILDLNRRYLCDHVVAAVQQELHLRLLACELTGATWPDDPFALPGTPLTRVKRDGRLMGAYSVGWNSRNDGGSRDDHYIGVYGPLAPTRKP